MLNAREISLVQEDWTQVTPISDKAATLFYDRLFALDPSLRTLFPGDLSEQKDKLVKTLTVAVKGLNKLEDIVPAVQALGKRHVAYGVAPAHYDTVGAALLWTLKAGLGDAFDAEHEAAWAKTYNLLADTMKAAAVAA